MSDIFISYARDDRETAQRLAKALETRGWSVWWDTRLRAGEAWDNVIARELDVARCVVVLWSRTSVQRQWVLVEAGEGLRRQVLVPVRIEDVEPPLAFRRIQVVDLIGWNGHEKHPGFMQMVEDVAATLLRGPLPPLPPPPPKPVRPVWKRISTAIAMVLLFAMPLVLLLYMGWNQPLRNYLSPSALQMRLHPQSPPAVASPLNPVLKFHAHRRDDTSVQLDSELSRRFELDTGIKIDRDLHDEEDRRSMLIRMFNDESDAFDVVLIDIIWVHEIAEHLVDLNSFFDDGKINSHDNVIINNNRVENSLVALPWFQNRGLLFYRQDLLDKYREDLEDKSRSVSLYRWDVPRTWQDLAAAAAIIQKKQIEENNSQFIGFSWQGARYEGLTCNALEWFASEGAYDLKEKEIIFDHEGVLNALDRARGWIKGVEGDNPISPHVRDHMEGQSLQRFLDGKAAFHRGWSNEYVIIKQAGIEFGVAPLPRGKVGENFGVLGGWQLAVPKYSRNQDLAIEFVRYLSSPAVQRWRAKAGGYQPTIEEVVKENDVKQALSFLEEDWFKDIQVIVRPSNRFYNKVSECIYNSVDSALNRNSRTEINQDIETMENCIDRASKGAISEGAVDG